MDWTDDGIVIGTRRHGEGNAIVELMTRDHGRHLGLVRGGAGSRLRPVLQPGNSVRAVWRARLDEHLGHYVIEGLKLRAALLLEAAHAVYGVTYLAVLCRLLPERDPHPAILQAFAVILEDAGNARLMAARIARFELDLIAELGFGLDLDQCAATGATADLIYVSPRSGRAVSGEAGAPWKDRLLRLPAFLRDDPIGEGPSADDLAAAFALTGFFLDRYVAQPMGVEFSGPRSSLVAALMRAVEGRAPP